MKAHLWRTVGVFASYWTRPARQATAIQTRVPLFRGKVSTTANDIISAIGERIHRAGRKARLVLASVTGMTWRAVARKFESAIKKQRTPKGLPEPVLGMDQYPEGRRAQFLGAHRPLLERKIRPVGGEHGSCTKFCCNGSQNVLGPLIERTCRVSMVLPPPSKMRPDG